MTWSPRYTDEDASPFLIDDGTGRAYVDPDGSELLLTSGDEIVVDENEEPPAHIREFLEEHTPLDAVSSRRRRYTEVRIAPGDTVLVAGEADPDATGELGRSGSAGISDGPNTPRFYISDDPDHGLRRRLIQEISVYFLAAALLFGTAAFLYL